MDHYDTEIGLILNDICTIEETEDFENVLDELLDEGYWNEPQFLFEFTDRRGGTTYPRDNFQRYGCLTQVHSDNQAYRSPFFEDEIVADERLHNSIYAISRDIAKAHSYADIVEILHPYAEWQRKIDEAFREKSLT